MLNKIKELRARHNLTQEALALKVGVRRETIVFLEKNKYNPSLKLAHDIAMLFDLSIEEVFNFEDNERTWPSDDIKYLRIQTSRAK